MATGSPIYVDALLASGECRGRDEAGEPVLVRGPVPGDLVQVSQLRSARLGRRAGAFKVLRPAADRRPAECGVQAECGGCALMPLSEPAQRNAKLELVLRSLADRGLAISTATWTEAPRALGYRNRVRLRVAESGALGFFNPDKPVSCAVLEESVRRGVQITTALAGDEPALFRGFAHVELRADDARGRPGLLVAGLGGQPPLGERVRTLARRLPQFAVGLRGDPDIAWQPRRVLDVTAFVPLDAFWQVNDAVNAAFVAAVRDGARSRAAQTALDLYAGAGNFSLPLASAGVAVTAVELHAPAVRALGAAASDQGLDCSGLAAAAETAVESLVRRSARYDLVVVDAPRGGARAVIDAIAALAPASVALCSCHAETFARDAAALVAAGYRLEQVRAFDMFPQTHHVELLGWLAKR